MEEYDIARSTLHDIKDSQDKLKKYEMEFGHLCQGGLHGTTPQLTVGRMKRNEVRNCTLEKEVEDRLRSQCNQTVVESGILPQEMISVLIDNCVFDTCSIYQNTSGNANVVENWLGEVQASVVDISDVQNKTTDTDVIPEILFQEPFSVTTKVTEMTEPGSSENTDPVDDTSSATPITKPGSPADKGHDEETSSVHLHRAGVATHFRQSSNDRSTDNYDN
ncbi:uncharacterized protein [Macrobrachium rosenbergii]|uniref:uncharacterized protein n=1 Tax=Macrobrachium rosenbergii TaxID=79674 RepID=UPI0034D526CF